ncbi:MAG: hypothetical protein ACI9D0_001523 [Bacteroidia bacterium]|jgi:hypothetical protein
MKSRKPEHRLVIGWREWVALPDLGIRTVKAKVDTGARTSSLHAFDLEEFREGRQDMVRFKIHPEQRSSKREKSVEARVHEWRSVRSSSGETELRPVILTTIEIFGESWEVELTLTRRDAMGFRMLLGRQAVRGHIVVDPGRSFLNGRRGKDTGRLIKPKGAEKKVVKKKTTKTTIEKPGKKKS